jgi:ribose 5-phosphate isomerase A
VTVAGAKRAAAEAAVEAEVRSGMRLGLGTGSTANEVLATLGARLADGRLHDLVGVPTSDATAARCGELGIPLATLDALRRLDVAIDGADEIDPELRLVKGLGGAHLREKVVACAADRFVVVADDSKLVGRLGERAPLPVEVIPFARAACERRLEGLGWLPALRVAHDGRPFATDEGNLILDCRRGDWSAPERLAAELAGVPGVVEHGMFLGIAAAAYVATPSGVRVLEAPAGAPSR